MHILIHTKHFSTSHPYKDIHPSSNHPPLTPLPDYLAGTDPGLADMCCAPLLYSFNNLLPFFNNLLPFFKASPVIQEYLRGVSSLNRLKPAFPARIKALAAYRVTQVFGPVHDHLMLTDTVIQAERSESREHHAVRPHASLDSHSSGGSLMWRSFMGKKASRRGSVVLEGEEEEDDDQGKALEFCL